MNSKRNAAGLLNDYRATLDPPGYSARVRELESAGLCTSDAQGVADVEFRDDAWLAARRRAVASRRAAWLS